MIIHPGRGWCYVGPPKTGSTTLHALLAGPAFGGTDPDDGRDPHRTEPPPRPDGWRMFASVRDPYARAVSLWRHGRRCPHFLALPPTFAEFAAEWLGGSRKGPPLALSPRFRLAYTGTQLDWLGGSRPGEVVRLESLADDLAALGLQSTPFGVPRLNPSWEPRPRWPLLYDRPTARVVQGWAGPDFDAFGYDPGFPPGSPARHAR